MDVTLARLDERVTFFDNETSILDQLDFTISDRFAKNIMLKQETTQIMIKG